MGRAGRQLAWYAVGAGRPVTRVASALLQTKGCQVGGSERGGGGAGNGQAALSQLLLIPALSSFPSLLCPALLPPLQPPLWRRSLACMRRASHPHAPHIAKA